MPVFPMSGIAKTSREYGSRNGFFSHIIPHSYKALKKQFLRKAYRAAFFVEGISFHLFQKPGSTEP